MKQLKNKLRAQRFNNGVLEKKKKFSSSEKSQPIKTATRKWVR